MPPTSKAFVIGIGSNKGDRLHYLRRAVAAIRAHPEIAVISISRIYRSKALLLPGSPKEWDRDYFNAAIKIKTTLPPEKLLKQLKSIESKLGRIADHKKWAPRVIDLDILSWENRTYTSASLVIPHASLLERSFALYPLLDVDPKWIHPLHSQLRLQDLLLHLSKLSVLPYKIEGTQIMGIINLTPISMSGPNPQLSKEELCEAIVKKVNEGAEIIDIGAESTRPGAEPLSLKEEWERLQPLMESLQSLLAHPSLLTRPFISIDTYHADTVSKLKELPINIINDVYGFEKEKIAAILKGTNIRYVLVHNMGKSGIAHMEGDGQVIERILSWFSKQIDLLLKAGLKKEQIILDPGIGFGKTPSQTKIILKEIERFKGLGYPILIGHSRKASAMPPVKHLPPSQRDLETAYLSKYLAHKKINFLRVHNCRLNRKLMDLQVSILVAHQLNRGIGHQQQLPWKLKEDLDHFKKLTLNNVVIMGRKTYESIEHPLASRENIVLSSQLFSQHKETSKVKVVSSLSAALLDIDPLKEVFIIGGERLYREGLKFSDKIYLTLVKASKPVDTFFPVIDLSQWRIEELFKVAANKHNQFPYEVKKLHRVWKYPHTGASEKFSSSR